MGTAQTTVEVSDVALQLQTDSSQRGQTITEYQTKLLPLVSRNYSDLVNYVTGAHQAPADATTTAVTSLTRAGSFNVNGQRSMFNDYMIDGMDNNAYGESNQGFDNQIIQPPPDSVAQFEVVTNNESAEYGRSSGATVNVASKSGANEFHTTLYEFIRNTDLNAFGYIKPVSINAITGTQYPFFKPVFNRNQFGANFGGADHQEQVLLLRRLRGVPAEAHADGGRYRSHDQRAQRPIGRRRAGSVESRLPTSRRARRIPVGPLKPRPTPIRPPWRSPACTRPRCPASAR